MAGVLTVVSAALVGLAADGHGHDDATAECTEDAMLVFDASGSMASAG